MVTATCALMPGRTPLGALASVMITPKLTTPPPVELPLEARLVTLPVAVVPTAVTATLAACPIAIRGTSASATCAVATSESLLMVIAGPLGAASPAAISIEATVPSAGAVNVAYLRAAFNSASDCLS
jgi:hypothetical protein